MISPRTPSALLIVLLCLPAVQAQLEWENCEAAASKQIQGVRTFCCGIASVASHCLAVVDLADGTSMVTEQEGNGYGCANCQRKKGMFGNKKEYDKNGCYLEMGAYIKCNYKSEGRIEEDDLYAMSALFARGQKLNYTIVNRMPEGQAKDFIAGYADTIGFFGGYDKTQQYGMTGAGLKEWATQYLRNHPYYRGMSTNCQKYSIGVYNSITHSRKAPKQWYSRIISPFTDLLQLNETSEEDAVWIRSKNTSGAVEPDFNPYSVCPVQYPAGLMQVEDLEAEEEPLDGTVSEASVGEQAPRDDDRAAVEEAVESHPPPPLSDLRAQRSVGPRQRRHEMLAHEDDERTVLSVSHSGHFHGSRRSGRSQ